MRFEWDEIKNRGNLKKHKISFDNAKLVFDDPHALADPDRQVDGEDRWLAIGLITESILVIVAYTFREKAGDEVLRIISARKASPSERRAYDKGTWPLG